MKILTFDIEDWFHILDNEETASVNAWSSFPSRLEYGVNQILELLCENNSKATFFCLGWVAETYPSIIERIHSLGFEIGSHSFAHKLVYQQNEREFREDLMRSMDTISQITGKEVTSYRAPGFSITEASVWAFDVLAEQGIEVDCSVFPAERAHGGLPGFTSALPTVIKTASGNLKSFPINTRRILKSQIIYSGGGYFRLFPLWLLKHFFGRDDYVMTYFHPRDFDHLQPIVPGLSRFRRFKSYVGLSGALNKLEFLLRNFEFVDLESAESMVDWKNTSVVKY